MTEARGREAWDHTAQLLALTFNIHRDPKKGRPTKPADWHPYMRPKGPGMPAEAWWNAVVAEGKRRSGRK